MEQLLKYFDMTEKDLGELLYTTNAFISGSAPLAVFLEEPIFPDMDLDIFLRVPIELNLNNYSYNTKCSYDNYEILAKQKIHRFLGRHGYDLCREYDMKRSATNICISCISYTEKYLETEGIEYQLSALSHFIKKVNTYQHKNGRKIQLITLYDCTIENFLETFDLNICRLVILGSACVQKDDSYLLKENVSTIFQLTDVYLELMTNHLTQQELDDIRNKYMYIYKPIYPVNLPRRIHKYIGRGFKWVLAKTYKSPISELSLNLNNIQKYISKTFPKITTFEEFMEKNNNIKEYK